MVTLKPCFSARAPCQARLRLSSTMALMSTSRCSPEPSRECSSMFLTMASARLPCCTTLSRLPCNVSAISLTSARNLLSRLAPASACRNSSINSTETPEKLLTKLSGFLIACAKGAVHRFDGKLVHIVAHHNFPPEAVEVLRKMYPRPPQPDQASGPNFLEWQPEADIAFLHAVN